MLTNNTNRKADQIDAANPRAKNAFGHIIEIAEDGGDFTATKGKWEMLLKCGDPSVAEVGATFSTATTANGWFGMPDNCAVDSAGRLWVATDGQGPKATGRTDGLWAVDTEGAARATSKLFFRVPVGAEMCGPLLHPGRPDGLRRRPASRRRRRRTGRPSAVRPTTRTCRPAGRISRMTCRSVRPSSPSPSRAAARSPSDCRKKGGWGLSPCPPAWGGVARGQPAAGTRLSFR